MANKGGDWLALQYEEDVLLEKATVERDKQFDDWVREFTKSAPLFYDTYLRWYQEDDTQQGNCVMQMLHGTLTSEAIDWP